MKTILKIAATTIALGLMLIADIPLLPVQLVPEAHAIFGTRRRTAVVAYSAGKSSGSQQAAASQQEAAAAKQEAAAAKQQAAAVTAAAGPLPLGTVVPTLPAGCVSTPVGGVEYYYCGGNFYRAVYQGNQLVYVTAKP